MPLGLPLPSLLSFAAGGILLLTVPVTLRYSDVPGVRQWAGVLGSAGLWSILYGASLLVFAPGLRELMESLTWLATVAVVCFLVGAGLKYTGHWRLVYSGWMAGFIGLAGGVWIMMTTNALGIHSLMWHEYGVQPVLGAAAADYEPTLLFFATVGVLYAVLVGAGILVFNTMLRYGPLYRLHAAVIALALLPVAAANLFWLYNLAVGPGAGVTRYAGLDPTPIAFLVSAAISGVGLLPIDLVRSTPATRQIAGHSVFDAIDTGVFLVNRDGIVLGLNEPAADIFEITDWGRALAKPWQEVTGVAVEIPSEDPVEVTFPTTPNRTHEVSTKPIEEVEAGVAKTVGYTVTIQDISRQKRRQQRLEVLNRVLRHNIRNDLTVIKGNAKMISDKVGDAASRIASAGSAGAEAAAGADGDGAPADDPLGDLGSYTEKIVTSSESLSRTAEKARDMSIASPEDKTMQASVDLDLLLQRVVASARNEYPEATIELAVPEPVSIVTDPDLLQVVVENLVENAIVHNDGDEPHVTITAEPFEDPEEDEEGAEIAIADDGPGIPEHELEVLEQGREEALSHGSGIGLWIVHWAITDLGGEIAFETDGGTTARITLVEPGHDVERRSRSSIDTGGRLR